MNGTNGTNGMDGPMGTTGPRGPQGPAIVISDLAQHGLEISAVPVNTSSMTQAQIEQVGRGSYIVNAIGACSDCHNHNQMAGPPQFLAGGQPFAVPGSNTDQVFARNLTPDPTTGLRLTEQEFIDSLRTGIDHKNAGSVLEVMPWPVFRWMGTDDLKAIYAYLQVIPPVVNMVAADQKGTGNPVMFSGVYDTGDNTPVALPADNVPDPGHVLRGLDIQPLGPPTGFDTWDTTQQALFGRGSYIVNAMAGCNDCHTNPPYNFASGTPFRINTDVYLAGGAVFEVPPPLQPVFKVRRSMSADLIGQLHGFNVSFPIFLATLTEGVHADDPDPAPLAFPMPWQHYRDMTIGDLEAVYTYVRNLTRQTSSRDKLTSEAARWCANSGDCDGGERCAGNECLKNSCLTMASCDTCQTCGTSTTAAGNTCLRPAMDSLCLTNGI